MGMSLEWILYLQKKGYLSKQNNKIMDIGPQNIYFATDEQIDQIIQHQGSSVTKEKLKTEKERIIYFSTPRPGERTAFLSELTDLTSIEYNSFDVCPGLKTEILDLNFENLPKKYTNYYDVVLNFGTTEHIINQWNSFKLMHEAAKKGGVFYHQVPATGWLDHGYFCYTPVFFRDLAKANGYEILDLFFTLAGLNELDKLGIELRDNQGVIQKASADAALKNIPCYNINVIMKKTQNTPFRCVLEIATTHAPLDKGIAEKYANYSTRQYISETGKKTTNKLHSLAAKIKKKLFGSEARTDN